MMAAEITARDPASNSLCSHETTVVCKNLPPGITVKDVASWMPVDLLVNVHLIRLLKKDRTCQIGTNDVRSAEIVTSYLEGKRFSNGSVLQTQSADYIFEKPKSKMWFKNKSIHVANLHPDCTFEQVFDLFKDFGIIMSIWLNRSPTSTSNMAISFVAFCHLEAGEAAVNRMKNHVHFGRIISVDFVRDTAKSKLNRDEDGYALVAIHSVYNLNAASTAEFILFFGPNHPLNRTSGEVQCLPADKVPMKLDTIAAAIKIAKQFCISKLNISVDNFFVKCFTQYCEIWRRNGWKTVETHADSGTEHTFPVFHARKYQEIIDSMEGIHIKWTVQEDQDAA